MGKNYNISFNLLKIGGARRTRTRSGADVVVVPVSAAGVRDTESGVYLNLTAWESRQEGRFGDTHYLVQRPGKEQREALGDARLPIIGNMKPVEDRAQQRAEAAAVSLGARRIAEAADDDEDLPF